MTDRDPATAPVRQRIIAVVVTFNRLTLVQRLVPVLLAQAALDDIVVVDNASADGTEEWLAEQDQAEPRVHHLRLDAHSGGAGGFRAGQEWAMAHGADLIWMMDDDGTPSPDCLDQLLAHQGRFDFWGPLVLDEDRPDRLVFAFRPPGVMKPLRDLADIEKSCGHGVVDDIVVPFNGVLVTRALVEEIGLVKSEYFIWGDDFEYLWRAEKAGARIGSVIDAHFHHPAAPDLGTPMMAGRTLYNHSPSDLKHYCMVRNNVTNLARYRGPLRVAIFLVKTYWFYTVTKPMPQRLLLSTKALWAAIRKDFTRHTAYLR